MDLNRRNFLKLSSYSAAGIFLATQTSSCGDSNSEIFEKDGNYKWVNWGGNQFCNPNEVVSPTSIEDLEAVMKKFSKLRFVGASHSFTGLVPNNTALVNLGALSGIISHDADNLTATFKAGSSINFLGRELAKIGQSLSQQPFVDYQSFAGAIATATHGTGRDIHALHHYITRLKLLTPKGELIECSETKNPDIFQAARVSLGALGALVEVTTQNKPLHNLQRTVTVHHAEEFEPNFYKFFEENRQMEAMNIPHSNYYRLGIIKPYSGEISPRFHVDDSGKLEQLRMLNQLLGWSDSVLEFALDNVIALKDKNLEDVKDVAHRVLSEPVTYKHAEMEYYIPFENGLACHQEIKKITDSNSFFFPTSLRTVKKDDSAWLSPFKKDVLSISVKAINWKEIDLMKKLYEPVFRKYGGFPHWGKIHSLTAKDFRAMYPRFNDFLEIRQSLDPKNKLMNSHLEDILLRG